MLVTVFLNKKPRYSSNEAKPRKRSLIKINVKL